MKWGGRLLVAVVLFLPPRPVAASANVKNPDTFIYAMAGDVDSLDPHWEYDGVSHTAVLQIYETLISYRGPSAFEYEPRLSLRVPSKTNGLVSPDGRRYKFPIRKDVRFHDEKLLTPEDVRYSVMRFLLAGPETGPGVLLRAAILGTHSLRRTDNQPQADLIHAAESAVRVEGNSVILELNKPFAPLLAVMATFCPIVSPDCLEGMGRNAWWVGRDTRHMAEALQSRQAGLLSLRPRQRDRPISSRTLGQEYKAGRLDP